MHHALKLKHIDSVIEVNGICCIGLRVLSTFQDVATP